MEGIGGYLLQSVAIAALAVFWYMLALFVLALLRRDNSIADIGWGPGFILLTGLVLWYHAPSGSRPALVLALVAIWGLRLSVHIFLRNWARGEDWRYAQWRVRWGRWWPLRSFLQVFLLQGLMMIVIALPAVWVATYGGGRFVRTDAIGLAVWLVGFLCEVIADAQLARFQKDPANYGRVLQRGLWRYSRHPNYFGEVLMWWGLWLIALPTPGGWLSVLGPLVITVLITRVSGIPLTESRQMANPEFRDYARRTSAFIPWFPKKV